MKSHRNPLRSRVRLGKKGIEPAPLASQFACSTIPPCCPVLYFASRPSPLGSEIESAEDRAPSVWTAFLLGFSAPQPHPSRTPALQAHSFVPPCNRDRRLHSVYRAAPYCYMNGGPVEDLWNRVFFNHSECRRMFHSKIYVGAMCSASGLPADTAQTPGEVPTHSPYMRTSPPSRNVGCRQPKSHIAVR